MHIYLQVELCKLLEQEQMVMQKNSIEEIKDYYLKIMHHLLTA